MHHKSLKDMDMKIYKHVTKLYRKLLGNTVIDQEGNFILY